MLSINLYQNLDSSLETRSTQLRATLEIQRGQAIFAGQPNELLLAFDSSGTLFTALQVVQLKGIFSPVIISPMVFLLFPLYNIF